MHRLAIVLLCLGSVLFVSCGDDDELPIDNSVVTDDDDSDDGTDSDSGSDTDATGDAGWLRFVPDWSDALADWTVPNSVYVSFAGAEARLHTDAEPACSDSLDAGSYAVEAWNVPKYIDVEDGKASVRTDRNGLLVPLPGYLFAASGMGMVTEGDTTDVGLVMRRLVAPLRITLNFCQAYAVDSVDATLGGLVPAVDLPGGTSSGSASTARLAWKVMDDNAGVVLFLHTLGIVAAEEQLLDVDIMLSDGRTISFRSDISSYLTDLLSLKPVALENTVCADSPEPEPDEPDDPTPSPDPGPWYPVPGPDVDVDEDEDAGFTATIEGWEVVEMEEIPIE